MIYKVEDINQAKYSPELFEQAYNAMSSDRRQKADKLRFEEDKRLCVFSDMMLREMLREAAGIVSPKFTREENGKPCLAGREVHFNISHSKSFIACAVDSRPIGIDVEAVHLVHNRLLRRVCTQEELCFVTGSKEPPSASEHLSEEESLRFLQVWTAKEAYIKYTGKGLGTELTSFSTAEDGRLKTHLAPDLKLLNFVTAEYILSIVSEASEQ